MTQNQPVVGAIRWDAWYGTDGPVKEVERSLGPKKFHFRLPYFATVRSDSAASIDGDSPEIMEQELAFAAHAGLDYWAFVDYWEDPRLTRALRNYRAARNKRGIRFCFVEEGCRLDKYRDGAWTRLVGFFRDTGYQTVLDGRPLLFVFNKPTKIGRDDFQALGAACLAAGLKTPYLVLMGWNPADDWKDAQALGFDAVSAYGAGGQYQGTMDSYAALTQRVVNDYWGVCRQHKIPVITFATTGWDTRPRIEHPPSWTKWVEVVPDPTPAAQQQPLIDAVTATPDQLAVHVHQAIEWTNHNRDLNPANAVILYAWNENDEGGWLIPTLNPDGSPNTGRIDALHSILRPPANP